MEKYNEILNLEEFGPYNMLSVLKTECENIIYLPNSVFQFQVLFSNSSDFNAMAYEKGNKSITNVSIGTIMQLYHHSLLVMGRGELLPAVGYEEDFEGKYRIDEFEEPKICQCNNQYKQIVFYAGPDNPIRQKAAELITLFGMEFLMFHELGHHIGGHIRYLQNNFGLTELYAQGSEDCLETQLYQILEMDADAIAISTLLESISTKVLFYGESFLNENTKMIPHCVIVAITMTYFLMNRDDNQNFKAEYDKYLPRDIRFYLVMQILLDKLDGDYEMCAFSNTKEQLLDTFEITNNLLAELYEEKNPEKQILFQGKENILSYYNDILLPLWKDLRKDLKQFAVINLPE